MAANSQPALGPGIPASTPAADTVAATPPPPPAPKKFIIEQGTQINVRLIDPIDSEKNQTGDTFRAASVTAVGRPRSTSSNWLTAKKSYRRGSN